MHVMVWIGIHVMVSFVILEAHHFGLSVGLKNDVGQIHELQPYFDWALNESCLDYDECNDYSPLNQCLESWKGAESLVIVTIM
jgi:hypothetical protein